MERPKLIYKNCWQRISNRSFSSLYLCRCGNTFISTINDIKKGRRKGCGCFNRTHGMTGTSEFNAWRSMKSRCYDVSKKEFKDYGGRGIKVCDKWLVSFNHFLDDMGKKPGDNYSLDRINNNKDYAPENCRWASKREQTNNRRNTCFIEYKGKRLPLTEWAKILGIDYRTLVSRFRYGWSVDKAFNRPVQKREF